MITVCVLDLPQVMTALTEADTLFRDIRDKPGKVGHPPSVVFVEQLG